MILEFEYTSEVGEGSSPQAVHMMDNSFNIIYLDSIGTVNGIMTSPEMGLYDSLTWKSKGRMSPDTSVSYPSLKKVAHYGVYGFWSSSGNHKFVMYMLPTDISHTIENGSITHSKDSAVSSASLTLQNINNTLLRRSRSVVSPNTKLAGRTETFAGKFTPQMIIGDSIEMTADGETETIGIVTSIRHTLGRKGFYTEFTVDSSGRKGKPMLKDYVSQISGSKAKSKVVIN